MVVPAADRYGGLHPRNLAEEPESVITGTLHKTLLPHYLRLALKGLLNVVANQLDVLRRKPPRKSHDERKWERCTGRPRTSVHTYPFRERGCSTIVSLATRTAHLSKLSKKGQQDALARMIDGLGTQEEGEEL